MAIDYMEVDRMESKKFADIFRKLIEPNRCYDNIANIALSHPHIQKTYPGIQVSYGGIQMFLNNNVYARHIVFLNNKKVIDPAFWHWLMVLSKKVSFTSLSSPWIINTM